MTAPGTVLWRVDDRPHPEYGPEGAELCVNMAAELLLIVRDREGDTTVTLTRDEALGLFHALGAHLTPPEAPAGLCGHPHPRDRWRSCTDPAGHAGDDGRGGSHGDGTVERWLPR